MIDFPSVGGRIFGELKVVVTRGCVFAHSSRPETYVFEPHVAGGKTGGSVAGMEYTANMDMAGGAEGDDHVAPDRRKMKTRRGRHRSRRCRGEHE